MRGLIPISAKLAHFLGKGSTVHLVCAHIQGIWPAALGDGVTWAQEGGSGTGHGEVGADEQKVPWQLSVNSQKRWIFRTKRSIFVACCITGKVGTCSRALLSFLNRRRGGFLPQSTG